ncbi:MAG TPA: caspase family protein [Candidatus Polarisedimenticolia bacterium]|nr:caspase family protein [Candidatus Polarisedimenticolia bacterium]
MSARGSHLASLVLTALGLAFAADTAFPAPSRTVPQHVASRFRSIVEAIEAGRCGDVESEAQDLLALYPRSGEYLEGMFRRPYLADYLRGKVLLDCRKQLAEARVAFLAEREAGIVEDHPEWAQRLAGDEARAREDRTPPEMVVSQVELVESRLEGESENVQETASVRIRGYAQDDGGVRSVSVNGRPIGIAPSAIEPFRFEFDDTIELRVQGSRPVIEIAAQDQHGNSSSRRAQIEDLPALKIPRGERVSAIVVGVDRYDRSYVGAGGECDPNITHRCPDGARPACSGMTDLKAAVTDARRMARLLRLRGVPERNIHLLISPRDEPPGATRSSVTRALETLPSMEGDRLIFYFAGHGIISSRQKNLMLLTDSIVAECPSAAVGPSQAEATSLDVTEIKERLKAGRFAERYLIVDACRVERTARDAAGTGPWRGFQFQEPASSGAGRGSPPESGLSREVLTFYGTSHGRRSIEWGEKGGYFTHFLLQALRRDYPLNRLFDFVNRRVIEETRRACPDETDCSEVQQPYLDMPEWLRANIPFQERIYMLGERPR